MSSFLSHLQRSALQLVALSLFCTQTPVVAQEPSWWYSEGILNDAAANNYAPATRGQLKNMAAVTFYRNERILRSQPNDATNHFADRKALDDLIAPWAKVYLWQPGAQDAIVAIPNAPNVGDNYAPVTHLELKRVAAPFYQRLQHIGIPIFPPWGNDPASRMDYALVNNGQLKNTFYALGLDTDQDGLPNWSETTIYHTLTDDTDSDDDTLSDYDEVFVYRTDPNDTDSDDDGLTDGDEVNLHHTDPNQKDSDDDGVEDGTEITDGTDPNDSDSDDDGLTDDEEKGYGTDPNDSDSDDDGESDGKEVLVSGTDPNDPASTGSGGSGAPGPGDVKPINYSWYSLERFLTYSFDHFQSTGNLKIYNLWNGSGGVDDPLTSYIPFSDLAGKFEQYGVIFPGLPSAPADFSQMRLSCSHAGYSQGFYDSGTLIHRRYWLKADRQSLKEYKRNLVVYTIVYKYKEGDPNAVPPILAERTTTKTATLEIATIPAKSKVSNPIDLRYSFATSQPENEGPDMGESVTQDVLPVEFKLRNQDDYEKGWDNISSDEPITCVGVGNTNEIIKFIGFHPDFEIVPSPESVDYVSVNTTPQQDGSVFLSISGLKKTSDLGSAAKIIFKHKEEQVALATLQVHVFKEAMVKFNLLYPYDRSNANSRIPNIDALPTHEQIAEELNKCFNLQGNISFSFGAKKETDLAIALFEKTSGALLLITSNDKLGELRDLAESWFGPGASFQKRVNFIVLNEFLQAAPPPDNFYQYQGLVDPDVAANVAFINKAAVVQTYAHETGHTLNISRSSTDKKDYHDKDLDPLGFRPLMADGNLFTPHQGGQRKRWIRAVDWVVANTKALSEYNE